MLLSSGNSNVIDVGLKVTLQDNFSQKAKAIKDAVRGIRDEVQMYQDNLRAARTMYGGLAAAGAMSMAKLWQGFEKGAHFDYIVKGAAVAAGATGKQFEGLYQLANSFGSKMGFLPEKVADAMQMLGKAGIDAKGIMEALRPVMNLAGGSMEDLSTSADIAISTMYQFGYQARDMGYISDVLAQGAIKSNINLRDLGESLKYASATAMQLKQGLPEVTAMIMTLGNAGMKGSMAGVGLENMYRYLSMGLGLGEFRNKARGELLTKLGIDPQSLLDSAGNMKHIVEVLEILGNAIKKYGNVDQQNILYQIFGVRGKRPPSVFLQDISLLKKNLEFINNSKGAAGAMYEVMMSGPWGAIVKMKAAWTEMVNDFSKTIAPMVTPLIQGITILLKGLKDFMGTGFGKVVVSTLTVFLGIKTVVWGLKAAFVGLSLALNTVRVNLEAIRASTAIAMGSGLGMGFMRPNNPLMTSVYAMGGRTWFSKGATPNNLPFKLTSTGRPYIIGPSGGAVFLSTAQAAAMSKKAGLFSTTSDVAKNLGLNKAGQIVPKMGPLMAVGMAGRGLLGALGGPWGLAIMGISIGLPLLVNALNKNSQAQDKNSEVVDENTEIQRKKDQMNLSMLSYIANNFTGDLPGFHIKKLYKDLKGKPTDDLVMERTKEAYMQNPKGRFYDLSNPNVINIYLDGKLLSSVPWDPTIEKEVNHTINKFLNPLGVK